MGRAKEIIVKVIPSKIANEFVKLNHYSGKVVQNSKLHFGCFLDNKLPNGDITHSMTIKTNKKIMSKYGSAKNYLNTEHKGWKPIDGKQLRYIYLIDKSCKINAEVLPFSEIDKQGAGMYKGEKITLQERRAND